MKQVLLFGSLGIIASMPLHAALTLYTNDQPGFTTAVSSMTLAGAEDWSSAGAASATVLDDSLVSGVAKGPFTSGSVAGLTVQSNTFGEFGSAPHPLGTAGLYYAPTNFEGFSGNKQVSNQLSTGSVGHSFDMIFTQSGGVKAISLSAMYYMKNGGSSTGTVQITVFDTMDNQLSQTSIAGVVDVSENSFFGAVATGSDTIGRVNVWLGSNAFSGADNITFHVVPEPGSLLLAGFSLLTLARRRR